MLLFYFVNIFCIYWFEVIKQAHQIKSSSQFISSKIYHQASAFIAMIASLLSSEAFEMVLLPWEWWLYS